MECMTENGGYAAGFRENRRDRATMQSVIPDAIEVDDIAKQFGEVRALDGVSFGVARGTVLGLLGPNGAGKTTAVRILTTTMRPDRGRASVLGLDVDHDAQRVRESIGLAGQYAAVDESLTGSENLWMMGRLTHLSQSASRSRSKELLVRFGLDDAGDRQVKTYSGGMRRRLDLAAALVHRPSVLFLDEPTTGLDPRSRRGLWDVIGELVADGTTLLLTTQYLEEADRLADRIVVIDQGQVIAEGTSAQLKARIGTTIIEAVFADPASAEGARTLLAPLGELTDADDGRALSLQVNTGPRSIMDAVGALERAAIEPLTLAVREPTLDDVFLRLTGQRVE